MKTVRIYGKYLSQYTVLYTLPKIVVWKNKMFIWCNVPRYIPEIHFAATPRIAP